LLSFCHKFNAGACCVPQLDDENNEFYGKITNLGLSCRIRGDVRFDPLAVLYCLNCDPQQPAYIRLGMNSISNRSDAAPYSVATDDDFVSGGDYHPTQGKATGRWRNAEEDKGTASWDHLSRILGSNPTQCCPCAVVSQLPMLIGS